MLASPTARFALILSAFIGLCRAESVADTHSANSSNPQASKETSCQHPAYSFAAAQAHSRKGDLDTAIGHYLHLLAERGHHLSSANNLALLYQRSGDTPNAIRTLQDALGRQAALKTLSDNLAEIRRQKAANLYRQAFAPAEQASINPQLADLTLQAMDSGSNADVLLDKSQYGTAVDAYQKLLAKAQSAASAQTVVSGKTALSAKTALSNNLALSQFYAGDIDAAISTLEQLLEQNPDYASASDNLGSLYHQKALNSFSAKNKGKRQASFTELVAQKTGPSLEIQWPSSGVIEDFGLGQILSLSASWREALPGNIQQLVLRFDSSEQALLYAPGKRPAEHLLLQRSGQAPWQLINQGRQQAATKTAEVPAS